MVMLSPSILHWPHLLQESNKNYVLCVCRLRTGCEHVWVFQIWHIYLTRSLLFRFIVWILFLFIFMFYVCCARKDWLLIIIDFIWTSKMVISIKLSAKRNFCKYSINSFPMNNNTYKYQWNNCGMNQMPVPVYSRLWERDLCFTEDHSVQQDCVDSFQTPLIRIHQADNIRRLCVHSYEHTNSCFHL